LQLLDELGPSRELAWSLVNLAELAAYGYDPACVDYAVRAITLGTQLVIPPWWCGPAATRRRAPCCAATPAGTTSSSVARRDGNTGACRTRWDDRGVPVHFRGTATHQLDRAHSYIAETTTFSARHDLGMFQLLVVAADGLCSCTAVIGAALPRWPRMC